VNDRQLGERLRRAFEAEQPPTISAAEILRRAEAPESEAHHADIQEPEPTNTQLRRPSLMPTGEQRTLGAVALEREEHQRRELEKTGRASTRFGTGVGSLFEPAEQAEARESEHDEPLGVVKPAAGAPPAGRRLRRWALSAVLVLVCLLVGGGLGYFLHGPTAASTLPTATSIVTRVVASPPQTKVVAPPACLDTAKRGDELMDLFTRNVRDRRLSLALKAYTLASQACRKEASP
jgi:hypothetical protein